MPSITEQSELSKSTNCVIIINDDSDILYLFTEALRHLEIRTFPFLDARLALEHIKAYPNQCSVIVINYSSLIKKYVQNFAAEAKALNSQFKIILMSGYSFNYSSQDLSNEGYDKFVQLPVTLRSFVSIVKEMLNSERVNSV